MRIWIRSHPYMDDRVRVYTSRDEALSGELGEYVVLCRFYMARLLKSTGKKLPEHCSDKIVTVDVKAR